MEDTKMEAGDPILGSRGETAGSVRQRRGASAILSNVMGRTERALRMALGGALIMALTMCDIPGMDYSFKYVGPFLFFVMGTLAPPFLSSGVILLFAGLSCILLACALATVLVSCLLISNGGRALCVFVYAVTAAWSSFLSTSKTKDMTLIGSYILLYAVPLAVLIASPYGYAGLTIEVTPERYAALREFVASSSIEQIRDAASHFFLIPPEDIDGFLARIGSPAAINLVLGIISKKLQFPLPTLPANTPVDPKEALNFFFGIATKIPAGRPLAFEMKLPRDFGLKLSQEWLYDVPVFVDGVSGEHVVVGARPGIWFIKGIWLASGPIGILRNLVIFAFLGFAIYLLVILVPPIRRQRDVAIREMAHACSVIRECLRMLRDGLLSVHAQNRGSNASRAIEEGRGQCSTAGDGRVPESESTVESPIALAVETLDNVVLSLLETDKAVLLSGMEPFLLYPGPGVWTVKELDAVRKRLIQCCIQTQHMVQLLHSAKKGTPMGSGDSSIVLASPASALLTKSMEMYELCENLLTTFPSICAPSKSKKHAEELIKQADALESELRSLALDVFRPTKTLTEKALTEMETDATAGPDLRNSDEETLTKGSGNGTSLERAVDLLPVGLANTAFVHAGFSEPVRLSRCIRALSRAQQVNTLRGCLMNVAFPFLPVLVHFHRLVIAPLSILAFWRLQWRGARAWWRDPETWYAVKLVIPLICIFACGIYLPDFLQYSWGVEVTKDPIFLDISAQGVATRMVPWFLLGFLTVLQTTYNGTVHRALARTIGIILGSFFGWAGLKWSGSNLAGLIAFCSVTVFVDIFIFADPDHPLDGFHKGWGYSGMVFTYTQALIVTLATEDLGGLTGSMDYLVTTRILSNIMGTLLAVIMAHLPPLASATTCTCNEYSQIVQHCTTGVNKVIHSFICICGESKDEHSNISVAKEKPGGSTSPMHRCLITAGRVHMCSGREEVTSVAKTLDMECKEHMDSAARLLREGRYVPILLPWQTSPSLAKVQVAIKSVLIEAQDATQLVLDVCDDDSQTMLAATNAPLVGSGEQELAALPVAGLSTQAASAQGKGVLLKSWSVSLMQQGNCRAIRELFQTSKGSELREALRCMCDSICTLAAAANVELCASLPAFGDKLMCRRGGYDHQGDSPGGPQHAYESCRTAVDTDARRVTVALVECLGEHCAAHRDAQAARTASAFVIMRLLYHLQSIKFSLDEVHAALLEGSKGVQSDCKLAALCHLGKHR